MIKYVVSTGLLALYAGRIPVFFGVDDALDTFSVHGVNGAWGLISVGCFGKAKFMNPDFDYGVFYGGNGDCLAWQIAATLVIIAVASSIAFASFGIMWLVGKYVIRSELENPLRISEEEELVGLDIKEFDGYAYPENTAVVDQLMSLSNHSKKSSNISGASAEYAKVSTASVTVGSTDISNNAGVEMSKV